MLLRGIPQEARVHHKYVTGLMLGVIGTALYSSWFLILTKNCKRVNMVVTPSISPIPLQFPEELARGL